MGRGLRRLNGAAAATTGRGHLTRGEDCQDRVSAALRLSCSTLALADGAGSAAAAGMGAEICTRVLEASLPQLAACFLNGQLGGVLADRLHGRVRSALEARAEGEGLLPRDLACTMLGVAWLATGVLAFQVGDGCIAARRGAGWERLLPGHHGEFSNQTTFVTCGRPSGICQWRFIRGADVDAVVLMSDGSESSLFRRDGGAAPGLSKLANWGAGRTSTAWSEALVRVLTDSVRTKTLDDCSLGFLVREPDHDAEHGHLAPGGPFDGRLRAVFKAS